MGHECDVCGDQFETEHGLKTHIGHAHRTTTAECAWCGSSLQRNPSDTERFEKHYCSMDCRRQNRRTGRTVECDYCGEPVYRRQVDLERNDHHFCDKTCAGKYRSAESLPVFRLESGSGYPTWEFAKHDSATRMAVHQLIVIATGADPKQVFSDEYNVHHLNGCRLDNRPLNLELLRVEEHGRRDGGKRVRRYSTKDMLLVIDFLLTPWKYLHEHRDES